MKPIQIITREDVRQKLREWRSGAFSAESLHTWANSICLSDDIDHPDWESDNSVTNEVIAALDMLDMNLNTKEDVDIFLNFLATPSGQFRNGYETMRQRLDAIDYDKRRPILKGLQPYAPFLK